MHLSKPPLLTNGDATNTSKPLYLVVTDFQKTQILELDVFIDSREKTIFLKTWVGFSSLFWITSLTSNHIASSCFRT